MKRLIYIICWSILLPIPNYAFQNPFGKEKNFVPKEKLEKYKGYLSDYQRISSKSLSYDLQFKVYTPLGFSQREGLHAIYLTDGPGYINKDAGDMVNLLDQMIEDQQIEPVIAIFIDARDPDNLQRNRRNNQFFGNDKYLKFITDELVPYIDHNYNTNPQSQSRAIMGLSFGGLNAAYAGVKAHSTFSMIGMQSPALHPKPQIYDLYKENGILPIKIFLSTGTLNDTEIGTRLLKKVLDDKGYVFKYKEVREGHNWSNWKPLIDEALVYFFGIASNDSN